MDTARELPGRQLRKDQRVPVRTAIGELPGRQLRKFGDLVQALAARGQAAPVIVNPRPFATPSEAPTVERPAADRVEALRARLAARAAGVRPV